MNNNNTIIELLREILVEVKKDSADREFEKIQEQMMRDDIYYRQVENKVKVMKSGREKKCGNAI